MTRKHFYFGAAALAFAAQAQSAQARIASLCPELNGNTLTMRVDSGCVSTSSRLVSNTLALEVDQNIAAIYVTGDMEFGGGRIQTADCMGRQSVTLTAEDVEARRYTIILNGERFGLADFLENRGKQQCLSRNFKPVSNAGSNHIRHSAYREWNGDPVQGWREWRGAGVLDLLSPILNGHPETTEGSANAEIKIRKASWRREFKGFDSPNWREPFVAVAITQHGYLDDSVSGGRYFAEVRMDESGQWKLDGFWSQQMCARGAKAGQWTKEPCP